MKNEDQRNFQTATFFKFHKSLFTTLWIILAFFLIWLFQWTTESDKNAYYQLMHQNDKTPKSTFINYQVRQKRFNITKHLFFKKNEHRLQMCLRSLNSELVFDHQENKTELVEHFNDLKCIFQESLFYTSSDGKEEKTFVPESIVSSVNPETPIPQATTLMPKQNVQYMEATQASYRYQTKELVAEEVKVSRYILPTHQFSSSLPHLSSLMHSRAKKIELSLSDPDKPIKIQGLHGTIKDFGRPL